MSTIKISRNRYLCLYLYLFQLTLLVSQFSLILDPHSRCYFTHLALARNLNLARFSTHRARLRARARSRFHGTATSAFTSTSFNLPLLVFHFSLILDSHSRCYFTHLALARNRNLARLSHPIEHD
jgi:hypothetical protein